MTNEAHKNHLKEYLLREHPQLSDEQAENIAASLLDLAFFSVRLFLDHKNQEK